MEELFARFVGNLHDRVGGPLSFRFLLQPTMAAFLAIRAGLRDARMGRPPYLWAMLTDPTRRGDLLRDGWKGVARVFGVAIIVDAVYQVIELHWFYPLEALIVAFTLACLPYLLIRGPVGRLAALFRRADRP